MINRRELLNRWCVGFGGLALNQLLAEQAVASHPRPEDGPQPPFPAKAKRIIFLFLPGLLLHFAFLLAYSLVSD